MGIANFKRDRKKTVAIVASFRNQNKFYSRRPGKTVLQAPLENAAKQWRIPQAE